MMEPQPHPITDIEGERAVLAVVVQLVMLLSLLEPVLDVGYEVVAGLKGGIHGHIASISLFVGVNRGSCTSIDDVEWRVLEGGMKGRIVAN